MVAAGADIVVSGVSNFDANSLNRHAVERDRRRCSACATLEYNADIHVVDTAAFNIAFTIRLDLYVPSVLDGEEGSGNVNTAATMTSFSNAVPKIRLSCVITLWK